ncbi:hypothetical protein [Bacteroides fluxus]|uniref:hypothetical protein n=1 Tax=Bacteroides fluxus TaxID=626930 RepID=UPI0023F22301|nr:hypothetical protein [Bacteroides fluxus]
MYKRRDLKCPVAPDFTSTGIIRGVGSKKSTSALEPLFSLTQNNKGCRFKHLCILRF